VNRATTVVAASLRVAAEQPVAIPLSFKGFGQAYDALIKQ
jgi:invasion protein IalB